VASIISASTLKILKDIAEGAMLDTVTITNPGGTELLPGGGWLNEEENEVVTKGRVGPLSKTAIERFQAERREYAGREQLEVPMDTVVGQQSRVSIASERHGGTREYTVEGVTPLGTYSVSRILIVKAVGEEAEEDG
jgi:hypothetical protein